ncbi:MAG: hypothetical protein IKL06_04550 [Lachnospiraceae bacterium]|nr:hypothetical protein [Lachnospiraceae bacterium]
MKKLYKDDLRVFRSDSIQELCEMAGGIEFSFPFDMRQLVLLKEQNRFEQEYFYIEHKGDFAFFILYKMKLNLFTFGKMNCMVNMQVIGYPCSLSEPGYITNNVEMMLQYIGGIKGAKLVLNVPEPFPVKGFMQGETLPTCIFINDFRSVEEYIQTLRSSYRRRIVLAIKKCRDIETAELNDNIRNIHDLYLNTYSKSEYKLEKLEKGFFEEVDAVKLAFIRQKRPIGFVLLKQVEAKLIFMLCGMDYSEETTDLYYYMLYTIICYGIEMGCKIIDFGQTSEETKMKFGAILEKRYFYAHHSNKIVNALVKAGKGLLEYKYSFPEFRVFKTEQTNESIIGKT